MMINRSNYEAYFLLYTDRELSAEDMLAVEQFAAENKDLAEELNSLLNSRLDPGDQVSFPHPNELYRTASTDINLVNYETYFLLLLDGELDAVASHQTLDFIATHPELQQEWELLQETTLPDDIIQFPDRQLLYRSTEKQVPVVRMQWWKIAVAAALIGWMMMGRLPFSGKDELGVERFKKNDAQVKLSGKLFQKADRNQSSNHNTEANKEMKVQVRHAQNTFLDKTDISNPPISNQPILNLPIEANTIAHAAPATLIPVHAIENESMHAPIHELMHDPLMDPKQHPMQESANYTITVYNELDTEDESKSLYIGTLEINKDKLRGFIRKAGSLIKGKIKTEEENIDTNSNALK